MSDEAGKDKTSIELSPHAKEKLKRLAKIGITEERVINAILKPEKLDAGYFNRKIAQTALSDELLLRVIFEETDNSILVITLYPAKRVRYE